MKRLEVLREAIEARRAAFASPSRRAALIAAGASPGEADAIVVLNHVVAESARAMFLDLAVDRESPWLEATGRCDHGRRLPCSRCEEHAQSRRDLNAAGCHCFDSPTKRDCFHEKTCPIVVKNRREAEVAERIKREAPLVALVAAVPEGLDPTAWRAAVLAATERYPMSDIGTWRDRFVREVADLCRSGAFVPPGTLTAVVLAVTAYRRALAPHKAPPPERHIQQVRVLPCDAGHE